MRAPAPAGPTSWCVHDLLVLLRRSSRFLVHPLRGSASVRRGRRRPRPRPLRTMHHPATALRPGDRGGGLRRQRAAVPPSCQERATARAPSRACGTARRGRSHLGDRRWNRWSRSGPFISAGTLAPRVRPRRSARPRIGARDTSAPTPRGASEARTFRTFGEGPHGSGAVGWGRPEHRGTAEGPGFENPPGR